MDSSLSRSSIQQALIILNQHGHFIASVLTDKDGLPLAAAAASTQQPTEMLAAVAPLVQRMVQRSNERVGLSPASEVVINNADKSRLVCRFFEARGQILILVCLVPDKQAYRRTMQQTIRQIQKHWAG